MIVLRKVPEQKAIYLPRKGINKECDDVFANAVVWVVRPWIMDDVHYSAVPLFKVAFTRRFLRADNWISVCFTYGPRAVIGAGTLIWRVILQPVKRSSMVIPSTAYP